jgi:hypothetical protein
MVVSTPNYRSALRLQCDYTELLRCFYNAHAFTNIGKILTLMSCSSARTITAPSTPDASPRAVSAGESLACEATLQMPTDCYYKRVRKSPRVYDWFEERASLVAFRSCPGTTTGTVDIPGSLAPPCPKTVRCSCVCAVNHLC